MNKSKSEGSYKARKQVKVTVVPVVMLGNGERNLCMSYTCGDALQLLSGDVKCMLLGQEIA